MPGVDSQPKLWSRGSSGSISNSKLRVSTLHTSRPALSRPATNYVCL